MSEPDRPVHAALDSEGRFRRFFELGLVGMAITSPTRGMIDVNDEMCQMFGYQREEFRHKTWAELTHPADLAADAALFDEVVAGLIDGYTIDSRFVRKDRRVVDATVSVRAVRRSDGDVAYLLALVQDVSERKRAERQVQAAGEQLRALSASLNSAREEEGRRIALQLHDELGSTLTTLKWDLEHLAEILPQADAARTADRLSAKIATMLVSLESAIHAVQRISSDLRPRILDDLGLVAAVEWQAEHLQARTGIACTVEPPPDGIEMSEGEATALFRICQEAITNIIRHAGATAARFRMAIDEGGFVLEIADNGKGIAPDALTAPGSLGLLGMRERARQVGATLDIADVAGGGVAVTVRLIKGRPTSRPCES
jgi:PAS domain S-box-containing protein